MLFQLLLFCVSAVVAYDSNIFSHASVPQFHHGAFQDVSGSIKNDLHRFLHSGAQIPFQVPLEVNVVLVGFNGDGGYRFSLDATKFAHVLQQSMPTHRPSFMETSQRLDIEHKFVYNVIPVGQLELMTMEKAIKPAMVAAGTARETEFGKEHPLYEIEAAGVEPIFDQLYSFLFQFDPKSPTDMNSPVPNAIFILNFDKARLDPRVNITDDVRTGNLSNEQLAEQESGYIYKYKYNGGASSQVWLSSGRYAVIDLSAGPCAYGKVDSEEGSVGYRSVPRLYNLFFPRGRTPLHSSQIHDVVAGQLSGLVASAIEHLISPDIKFGKVDTAQRLLVSVIVLRNHHRYNLLYSKGNHSIDMLAVEKEVKKMVQPGQEVVVVSGMHNLHDHEKLAISVAKALHGVSVHDTGNDGRFHAKIRSYLDGSELREEMKHSADVLASGLLELADPSLSNKYFHYMEWDEEEQHQSVDDSIVKSIGSSSKRKVKDEFDVGLRKSASVRKSYGTRVVPVFVLSLAGLDKQLLLEGETLLWTNNDAVFVLQHESEPFPLSYVSETRRREAIPASPQRHIIAGLAAVVGGLASPYERASHVHERPLVNWLWACGHHPFGPFSNTERISQLMFDVAMRNSIYARVDQALQAVRICTDSIQEFTNDFLKTPLGAPVKGQRNKWKVELWVDKFYKKTTNLPEPIPHQLVEQLEKYLDELEQQLIDISTLLYDHKLQDAHNNSTNLLHYTKFAEKYVEHVLASEKDRLRCCRLQYGTLAQTSKAFLYGGILFVGLVIYFAVIYFS